MKEQGTVVFLAKEHLLVLKHARGHTVVELYEDGTGIGVGDVLHASHWDVLGSGTIGHGNVTHFAAYWGTYDRLNDAHGHCLRFAENESSKLPKKEGGANGTNEA